MIAYLYVFIGANRGQTYMYIDSFLSIGAIGLNILCINTNILAVAAAADIYTVPPDIYQWLDNIIWLLQK